MAARNDGGAANDRGPTEGAGAEAQPAKGGKRRLVMVVVAAVVVLAAAAAGILFSGVLGGESPPAADAGAADAHAADKPKSQAPAATVFHPLPDLVISLNSVDRRAALLKLRLTVEVASSSDIARIESQMPRVIDYCQLYLRELRPEDLHGSAGTFRLKEELMRRINAAVAPTEVLDVLLSELMIQ